MPGTTLSRGNILYDFAITTVITPTALTASTSQELSFTVPGILPGDVIATVVPPATQTAGVVFSYARVTAANTLVIGYGNCTAGTPTPVAGAHIFRISRPEGPLPLPTNAS